MEVVGVGDLGGKTRQVCAEARKGETLGAGRAEAAWRHCAEAELLTTEEGPSKRGARGGCRVGNDCVQRGRSR